MTDPPFTGLRPSNQGEAERIERAPYPGLRPFSRSEADIFFGRESHIDTMIDRLAEHRFLAVTGASGSGKSSLVRAGLLQGLEMGLLGAAGPNWRVAEMRPGEHPMYALRSALDTALGRAREESAVPDRGPRTILADLRDRPLPGRTNLLILVDQFEELFRYESLGTRNEAEAFVGLLLGIRRQPEIRAYVVLTMRSDFLGNCAKFEGLAEAVNDSMYLCPRLDRDQIAAAIERPAGVFGGCVEPALVERLIADMGTDPDQLPLMQHALLRLWEQAIRRDALTLQLRLADYLAAGGLKGSLSGHADEVLDEVIGRAKEREEIVRRLFLLLVEGESADGTVRRPTAISELIAVTGAPLAEIAEIADAFRRPGRNFLMPPIDQELRENSVLDISHESFIRQWNQMADWVRLEATSAEQYREIGRRARRWQEGQASLLGSTELDIALAWRDRERPNSAWARRYGGSFSLVMRLLDESKQKRSADDAERQKAAEYKIRMEEREAFYRRSLRRTRIALVANSAVTLLFVSLAVVSLHFYVISREQAKLAEVARETAETQEKMAEQALSALKVANAVASFAISPDGRYILVTRDNADHTGNVSLIDAMSGKSRFSVSTSRSVTASDFSPDGTMIAVGYGDGSIELLAPHSGMRPHLLPGHSASITKLSFSPDAMRLASASYDGTCRLWNISSGRQLMVYRFTAPAVSIAFTPEGSRLVASDLLGSIVTLDTATGALLMVVPPTANHP